ncbi:MDR family MFS transporter [Priestia megaterium]|uniref:MDR family MFS transporter n=1 Tax=Priestia megaterium TaxID=1404 RepID=UPI00366EED23
MNVNIQLNPKLVVSIIYVIAMFMAAMDGTIVNVALPTISKEFQISPSSTGGINVGYLVSLAVFLPIAGWLGDRWGTKKIFLIALSIFTISSVLCGLANNLHSLNLFRICQGAGGGLLTPVGMAMLYRTFSPEERSKIARTLILPIAVAPALGPILGGFLVEQFSWPWVFYINLPFGILALLFGLIFLVEYREPKAGRLDLLGFLLSAPGLSMLMYALNQGPITGWISPSILIIGGSGFILLSCFILVELRVSRPMLDLRLLSDGLFRSMSIISLLSAAGLLGILYVFPLMYQNALKASALESGLITFPEALGLIVASRMMPWSSKKLGVHRVIIAGLLGAAIMLLFLSMVGPETSPWVIRMLLFSIGFFLGHAVVSVQATIFNNINSASMGQATTLFNVQNRIGSAVGIAILASLLGAFGVDSTNTHRVADLQLIPYQVALIGSAAFLLGGLFFTLFIRKTDITSSKSNQSTSKPSHIERSAKVGN